MFTVERTKQFSDWLIGLADPKARAAIAARIVRVELGNFGDVKSVGGKVSELRVDVGPGYRIYLTRTGLTVQLLLCGGDKSTQQSDIKKAQEMGGGIGRGQEGCEEETAQQEEVTIFCQEAGNMTIEVRPFDAAEYLHDEASQRAFLDEAADSNDPSFIARAIGVVARAKGGMLHLERLTGIKRQTLTKSFGADGNPTLSTLIAVLKALHFRVRFEHVPEDEKELTAA